MISSMIRFFTLLLAAVMAVNATALDNYKEPAKFEDHHGKYDHGKCISACDCNGFGMFDEQAKYPRVMYVSRHGFGPYRRSGQEQAAVIIVKNENDQCCFLRDYDHNEQKDSKDCE